MILYIKVIMLSKLDFMLLAPTPSFLLAHLVQVRGEKDWPQDLSRYRPVNWYKVQTGQPVQYRYRPVNWYSTGTDR